MATVDVIDEMVPPESMIFVGQGDFKQVGQHFLQLFVELGGLQPHDRVLDVGCGIGRMAIPLTQYLAPPGGYEGFDVVESGVQWCQRKITTRYPHFHFQLANVLNKLYNPKAWRPAESYRFPYADGSFDFVFMTSVFTHLMPDAVENYLAETARVLARGGRSFITMFLLNDESLPLVDADKTNIKLPHQVGECRVERLDIPEHAVGYPEDNTIARFEHCGLRVHRPIHYGNWCWRDEFTSFQDIIVATKD
jgi:SAM-dependent methyltransferase